MQFLRELGLTRVNKYIFCWIFKREETKEPITRSRTLKTRAKTDEIFALSLSCFALAFMGELLQCPQLRLYIIEEGSTGVLSSIPTPHLPPFSINLLHSFEFLPLSSLPPPSPFSRISHPFSPISLLSCPPPPIETKLVILDYRSLISASIENRVTLLVSIGLY